MLGIVYATRREADPFLSRVGAQERPGTPLSTFEIAGGTAVDAVVVVSGMGKVAAALAAAHLVLADGVCGLINAGLCGLLTGRHGWCVGELLRIDTAMEGDCDRFGCPEVPVACTGPWFAQLPAARLVTCDRPVFDRRRREQLAGLGDLVDMEGAAVARVAQRYDVPCALIKGISDAADETGRRDLAGRIDRISERLGDLLARELARDLQLTTVEGD